MYLSILKENEKELFLELVYALSSVDGDVANEEKIMIQSYCDELGIVASPSNISKLDVVNTLAENSDIQSKKIIIFELIGLAMTDNNYNEEEKEFVLEAVSKFGLTSDFIDSCEKIILEYLSFQEKINNLILV